MAKRPEFSIQNQELKEMEYLTKSIGKAMDNIALQSERHFDALNKEVDLTTAILKTTEETGDIQGALNKLKNREGTILKQNWGINSDIKQELLEQNKFAQQALQIEMRRRDIVKQVAASAENVTEGINDAIDSLKSSISEIPVLGKVFDSLIPYDSIKGGITKMGNDFTRGFSVMFTRNLQQKKGFIKSFSSGMTAGFGQLSKTLGPLLSNPYTAAAIAIAAVAAVGVLAFYKVASAAKAFREETGLLNSQTAGLDKQMVSVLGKTSALGASLEDISKSAATFTNEFGGIEMASDEVLTSMMTLNKNFGIGVQEGAKLNKIFQNIGGLSAEQSQYLVGQTVSMAKLANVAPQQVIKDMAENSEYAYKYFNGSPEALAKAAVQAAKLGTSIGQAGKVADGLLDFQNSITAELEASALLGTNINLGQARYLAANGKILESQQAVLDEVAAIGDISKLNTYEQEALAKATGMSYDDLVNQQRIRERFGKLSEKELATAMEVLKTGGDISKMNSADLAVQTEKLAKQKEMQSEFDNAGNQLAAIGNDILMSFMPIGMTIMKALGPIMQIVGGLIVGFLKPFMAIINSIFDHISKAFAPISKLMGPSTGLFDIFEQIGEVIGFITSLFYGPVVLAIETVVAALSGVFDIIGGVVKLFKGDFIGGLTQIGDGILSFMYKPFVAMFNTIMDYVEGFFTIFESLGQWMHENLIDPINNFVGGIGSVIQSVGSIFGGGAPESAGQTPTQSVNDGVMQNGSVISTSPEDYLIATKNPQGLANAVGGGGGIDISALVNKMDEMIQAVSQNRDVYMDREKVSSAVVKTSEKSSQNRFGLLGA